MDLFPGKFGGDLRLKIGVRMRTPFDRGLRIKYILAYDKSKEGSGLTRECDTNHTFIATKTRQLILEFQSEWKFALRSPPGPQGRTRPSLFRMATLVGDRQPAALALW